MDVVVFEKILELIERAATNHLAQKQEQPVNVPFLSIFKRRLDAVVLPAMFASRQHRLHPNRRCPLVHISPFPTNKAQQL